MITEYIIKVVAITKGYCHIPERHLKLGVLWQGVYDGAGHGDYNLVNINTICAESKINLFERFMSVGTLNYPTAYREQNALPFVMPNFEIDEAQLWPPTIYNFSVDDTVTVFDKEALQAITDDVSYKNNSTPISSGSQSGSYIALVYITPKIDNI